MPPTGVLYTHIKPVSYYWCLFHSVAEQEQTCTCCHQAGTEEQEIDLRNSSFGHFSAFHFFAFSLSSGVVGFL
ncbi:hypothetical protein GCM10011571_00830 [Marinithermofilum abyssi]|uniref:Uncharacterized protein n=1 Tax=Marinithermofilum abyssi TaxID=1571185 RepID=A0A8J2VGT7_9BACL|nr:hypothetical protein [Marinithermofilum abyssi]GGE03755.1 hypothetical protein GCM10011571_00830 [Marinithermofilum abyssi]